MKRIFLSLLFLCSARAATTVTALVVNPSSVLAGDTSIGDLGLSASAGSKGLKVNLSSSLPAVASVPSSVTVPSGECTYPFLITTYPVTSTQYPVITASTSGNNKVTATLTVYPQSGVITDGTAQMCSPGLFCTRTFSWPSGGFGSSSWWAVCNGTAGYAIGGWNVINAGCAQTTKLVITTSPIIDGSGTSGINMRTALYASDGTTLLMESVGWRKCDGTFQDGPDIRVDCGDHVYVYSWIQ